MSIKFILQNAIKANRFNDHTTIFLEQSYVVKIRLSFARKDDTVFFLLFVYFKKRH